MPNKNFVQEKYAWKNNINYRLHPEKYRVGKGEQGVLLCEPYKSEILPYWKFKTPVIAKKSALKIYQLFRSYLKQKDFIGADLARKYLQMGFTRARRYTNYKGGRKYSPTTGKILERNTGDPQKAISAAIFYQQWQLAEANTTYKKMKHTWKEKYG